jgi:hypothetical protein
MKGSLLTCDATLLRLKRGLLKLEAACSSETSVPVYLHGINLYKHHRWNLTSDAGTIVHLLSVTSQLCSTV